MSVFTEKSKSLYQKIPGFFKELRHQKGLTMRSVAERIGTSHSFVGKTERMMRRMDLAEFVCYCEGLKADPRRTFDQLLRSMDR